MTKEQKKEALNNALGSFGFDKEYFIQQSDARLGHKFAIATENSHCGTDVHTNFMTYEELNAYLRGYNRGEFNRFPKKL